MLSEEIKQRILAYLPRYPSKQAVVLPALHLVQDELRHVPLEAIREIADLLDLSPAEVHDAMSFYGFFRTEKDPLGRTRLWMCRGLACALRGGEELLKQVCDKLRVQPGGGGGVAHAAMSKAEEQQVTARIAAALRGTTADGKITVEFAECLGGCEGAPCALVNDEHRMNLSPEKVDMLINELLH